MYPPQGQGPWQGHGQPQGQPQGYPGQPPSGYQQPHYQQHPGPAGATGQGGPYGPPGWQPQRPPKKRRTGLIIGIVCAGLAVVLVGGIALTGLFGTPQAGGKDSAIFKADSGFVPDAKVTASSLAETDPESIYWTMLRKQLKQPYLTINHQYYMTYEEFQQDPVSFTGVDQAKINYKDQVMTVGNTSYEESDTGQTVVDIQTRCVDGQAFTKYSDENHWELDELGAQNCEPKHMKGDGGDGLAAGGLTDEQADGFIDYVQSGLGENPISVRKPEIVENRGKQYIKLPVKLTPIKSSYGSYSGTQIFIWAMQDIGVHPASHLYSSFGTGASGVEMTYYIDPETTLPAYLTLQETPPPDGGSESVDYGGFKRVQYDFPKQWQPYDLENPKDEEPITIDWDPAVP